MIRRYFRSRDVPRFHFQLRAAAFRAPPMATLLHFRFCHILLPCAGDALAYFEMISRDVSD